MRAMIAMLSLTAALAAVCHLWAQPPAQARQDGKQVDEMPMPGSLDGIAGELTYTTYFYTAGEAIIHGFEDGTKVRVGLVASASRITRHFWDSWDEKAVYLAAAGVPPDC